MGITGNTGATGNPGPSLTGNLFCYATGHQNIAAPNTYQLVRFWTAPITDGWTPLGRAGSYTGFLAGQTGLYAVEFRYGIQLSEGCHAISAEGRVVLNGTEIKGSQDSIRPPITIFNLGHRNISDLNNSFLVNVTALPAIIGFQVAATRSFFTSSLNSSTTTHASTPTCATAVITRIK
jgi:hypothetical protein